MAEGYGTLKELAVNFAKVQQHQVEAITEDTDVLNTIPFEAASHDLWNAVSAIQSISGGGFGDMSGPLAKLNVKRGLEKVDLQILGGEVFVPQDNVVPLGGPAAFFSKNEKPILRKLGMDAEIAILYNNLRQFAIDLGGENKTLCGGAGNANYSILIVRWVPGETVGLYSPKMFKAGQIVVPESLSGGNLYQDPTTKVNGYGMQYKGYLGMQLLNKKSISVLCNVTSATKPTAMQMDDALAAARANKKSTFIYCHPKAMNILADVGKSAAFRMGTSDTDVNREIEKWNGVRIVTSYNFMQGTEANVA